jgi:heptaprenyl diphosphate synthase
MPETTEERWLVCPDTMHLLTRLDPVMRLAIEADDLQLRTMALHLLARGGKRLRPSLLFLASTFGTASPERLLRAAAALELLHVASLYHDDLMDRAVARRNAASANLFWGNEFASLVGTYLFARASVVLSSLGDTANRLASAASVAVCTGQLQEVENAYNLELTEELRIAILQRKTATLFELPCRLGGMLAGCSDACIAALATYGRYLGLAFQLADDALDFTGDAAKLGKAIGTDIREGVYSVPVLRVVARRDARAVKVAALLSQALLTEEDVGRVIHLVCSSGAVEETRELARSYGRRAQDELAKLPTSLSLHSLLRLAEYAVERTG